MTRKKKHQSTFLKKEERAFWGFISPWLIGFILLTFGPMLYSFYASFTNWNGIKAPEFIGLENYRRMFMDDSSLSNRVLLSPDTAHIAYWLLYSVA